MKKYLLIALLFSIIICITLFACTFLSNKKTSSPYLSVVGPVMMADGIGRQAVYFMDTLYGQINMEYCPSRKTLHLDDVPERILPFLKTKYKKKVKGKVLIYQDGLDSFPHSTKKGNRFIRKLSPTHSKQIRIAYSMTESSRIPSLTASFLNTHFDAIAVPDEYLVEVYALSGVTLPIFVLPLGLDLDLFLEQPLKKKAHKPFCFINTSSLIPRKNHDGLIRAFHKAFGNTPDVHLCMNYRYAMGDALSTTKNLLENLSCTNITLTNKPLLASQYLDFLLQGDVFVTLSKGEGFSIQPREAMALGLPVIISDNTAHKTILKSHLVQGISCPYVDIPFNPILHSYGGEEYSADIDEAALVLRDIYENYEISLLEAEKRREWVRQYRYQNLTALCLSLVKPKNIILCDKNQITEEALMTSSTELYKKYKKICQ